MFLNLAIPPPELPSTWLLDEHASCTLLQLAVAGPAPDIRLVEWLIQMGALHLQPSINRTSGTPEEDLPDHLAVHSAVIAGHAETVRLILEIELYRDIDTTTLHSRQSLVHLAVKHGRREVYKLLLDLQANLQLKDANLKSAFQLARDREWKSELLNNTLNQAESHRRDDLKPWREKLNFANARIRNQNLEVYDALQQQQQQEKLKVKSPKTQMKSYTPKAAAKKKREKKK